MKRLVGLVLGSPAAAAILMALAWWLLDGWFRLAAVLAVVAGLEAGTRARRAVASGEADRAWASGAAVVLLMAFAVFAATLRVLPSLLAAGAGFTALEGWALAGRPAPRVPSVTRRRFRLVVVGLLAAALVHVSWPTRVAHPPLDGSGLAVVDAYAAAWGKDDRRTLARLGGSEHRGLVERLPAPPNGRWTSRRRDFVRGATDEVQYRYERPTPLDGCEWGNVLFTAGRVGGAWKVVSAVWTESGVSTRRCPAGG